MSRTLQLVISFFAITSFLLQVASAQLVDISYRSLYDLEAPDKWVEGDPLPTEESWLADQFRFNRAFNFEITNSTDEDRWVKGILGFGADYMQGDIDVKFETPSGLEKLNNQIIDGYMAFGTFYYRHGILARLALNVGGGVVLQKVQLASYIEPEREVQGAIGLGELRLDVAFLKLFDAGAGVGFMARYRYNRLMDTINFAEIATNAYSTIEKIEMPNTQWDSRCGLPRVLECVSNISSRSFRE
ncbi:hypothetical protein BMS3Bbin04_00592 [bacterium BMS3Bbin04]|nr:hypothetical protein BMS3Bbin04_00592 [bacterium BMS3Bbin04]